jgi:hypothetical protein
MTVTNYSPTDTLAWRNLETLSQAEADITIVLAKMFCSN